MDNTLVKNRTVFILTFNSNIQHRRIVCNMNELKWKTKAETSNYKYESRTSNKNDKLFKPKIYLVSKGANKTKIIMNIYIRY